jgi:hypothetical protein
MDIWHPPFAPNSSAVGPFVHRGVMRAEDHRKSNLLKINDDQHSMVF